MKKGKKLTLRCLTIGGSDSCGGAGIEADLAIFRDADVAGSTIITALTAQNSRAIHCITPTPVAQIDATVTALAEHTPIHAIKTGMLVDRERVKIIAHAIHTHFPGIPLVVDPVLVASSGRRLLADDALRPLCNDLLPQATVITPNLKEAEVLSGAPISDPEATAQALAERFSCAILLKGGHGSGATVSDILATPDGTSHHYHFPRRPLDSDLSHGTGCRCAAAIAAALAHGIPTRDTIPIAHRAAIDGHWSAD